MEIQRNRNVTDQNRPSVLRHNRTTSDIAKQIRHSEPTTNGLKAVNTVAGALQNILKWSALPLSKSQKARSFDSLHSESHVSLTDLQSPTMEKEKTEQKRRSSSTLLKGLQDQFQRESSPEYSSSPASAADKDPQNSPSIVITKRESSPSVSFSISESASANDRESSSDLVGTLNDSKSQRKSTDSGTSDSKSQRKSTDSGESGRGNTPSDNDQSDQVKSFEKSLNNILNKCAIENAVELDGEVKGDDSTLKAPKGERKKKSTPWYSMLSPTYKSRSEDFKRQFRDQIPSDERLIVDYSCAVQKEILVHGRMFVTQNWICFYANIFRWETVITLPTKEICAITKEKTARVIPNAIQITTEKEKCFFTSFTARDKTFMMLFRIWQNALMEQPMSSQELWQWVHSSYGSELGLTSSDDDYVPPRKSLGDKDGVLEDFSLTSKGDSSDLVPAVGLDNTLDEDDSTQADADISLDESVSAQIPGTSKQEDQTDMSDTTEDDLDDKDGEVVCSEHAHFSRLVHNEVYQMTTDKLFELMFTDSEFFRNFTAARKLQDVTLSAWQDSTEDQVGRVRELTYTVPLTAPFGPKTSHTVEKHSCYKQSQPGVIYVIDAECTPTGIPYADAFFVHNRYCLTRVSRQSSRLRVTSEVKYKKSVWGVVKNMIERNCVQGVLDYFQCLGIHLRRESDKHQLNQGKPTSKRKLRKRRGHVIRSANAPGDLPSTSRQVSRSHTAEKMITPPTPVRNMIAAQKEEKLLKMNADTLVRIVCFILVLLMMFNTALFYKLWSLEATANKLYFPYAGGIDANILNQGGDAAVLITSSESSHFLPTRLKKNILDQTRNPPQNQEEWLNLLNQQQKLHEAQIEKWKIMISTSIALIEQMKETLQSLQEGLDNKIPD